MQNKTTMYTCHKPTLGFLISLKQMAKENHLQLLIVSHHSFKLIGSMKNHQQLKQSRGWKQSVRFGHLKQGAL